MWLYQAEYGFVIRERVLSTMLHRSLTPKKICLRQVGYFDKISIIKSKKSVKQKDEQNKYILTS